MMENLDVDEIIRLREEAIQRLLVQKSNLQEELNTITIRLVEIDEQLRKLGYQVAKVASISRASKRRKGRLYEYHAGQGFIFADTGEIIGPGINEDESLLAIKSWCEKVGRNYYVTQWKRVINPDYGKKQ
jgi:hypothetical protein